jgi:hypothetical protein
LAREAHRIGVGSRAKEQDVRSASGCSDMDDSDLWMRFSNQTGKENNFKRFGRRSLCFFMVRFEFDPYKTVIAEKLGRPIDCMNIYNASEGFFGFQYTIKTTLMSLYLLTHHDVFYECHFSIADFRAMALREAIPLC